MASTPLSQRLRTETAELHRWAERSGVMYDLLRGRVALPTYRALLCDLLAVYSALEERLDATVSEPLLQAMYDRHLHRAEALRNDLETLGALRSGRASAGALPGRGQVASRVPGEAGEAAMAYAARIRAASPLQLAAHAYVRYLGDLSGGQAMAGVVARALALAPGTGVAFYRFAGIPDVDAYKARFRAALDALPLAPREADDLVREAQEAFRLNVRVFEDVARRTAPSGAPPPPPGG